MAETSNSTSEIGFGRIIRRGLTRRCPVCGEWNVFDGWFRQKPSCPQCGFVFARKEGQFIGAIGVNTSVTAIAIVLSMIIGFAVTAPDFSLPWILGSTVVVSIVVPTIFFPVSKTLWAAMDILMIPLEETEAPLRQRPLRKNDV